MKRLISLALIATLASTGCTMTDYNFDISLFSKESKEPPRTKKEDAEKAAPAPVTADQIREENAREKLDSLQIELDRDEKGGLRIGAEVEVESHLTPERVRGGLQ
jgi:hypothetical protein